MCVLQTIQNMVVSILSEMTFYTLSDLASLSPRLIHHIPLEDRAHCYHILCLYSPS